MNKDQEAQPMKTTVEKDRFLYHVSCKVSLFGHQVKFHIIGLECLENEYSEGLNRCVGGRSVDVKRSTIEGSFKSHGHCGKSVNGSIYKFMGKGGKSNVNIR